MQCPVLVQVLPRLEPTVCNQMLPDVGIDGEVCTRCRIVHMRIHPIAFCVPHVCTLSDILFIVRFGVVVCI